MYRTSAVWGSSFLMDIAAQRNEPFNVQPGRPPSASMPVYSVRSPSVNLWCHTVAPHYGDQLPARKNPPRGICRSAPLVAVMRHASSHTATLVIGTGTYFRKGGIKLGDLDRPRPPRAGGGRPKGGWLAATQPTTQDFAVCLLMFGQPGLGRGCSQVPPAGYA